MQTIKVNNHSEIPDNFTGIADYKDGTKIWFLDGKWHREDGPAREFSDGAKYWHLHDKMFSEKQWKIEVEKLQKNRAKEAKEVPAMKVLKLPEHDDEVLFKFTGIVELGDTGERQYLRNGELHRIDGPAIEHPNGAKFWYLNGRQYDSEKEWKLEVERREENGTQEEPEIHVIQVDNFHEIPHDFTGVAQFANGDDKFYLNGYLHREDGPAIEWENGKQ